MWTEHLFRQSSLVMATLDCDGIFTSANPAAEHLFGRPSGELIGQPFAVFLDQYSCDKGRLMIERTFAEGGVVDWELDHIRADGEPVLIGYTTTVLHDDRDAIIGLAMVGHDQSQQLDLTARLAVTNQQLEGALRQLEKAHADLKFTQAQLVQSEKMRALGQLVAGVAHEINTPLAFVANNIDHLAGIESGLRQLFVAYAALRKRADGTERAAIDDAEQAVDMAYLWDDLHDLITESQDGAERIRTLVHSLRNFARLDEAETKEADINEGLISTIRIVRPLCKERIEITERYSELPPIVCRPSALNQVFLNLLTNAIQAIEDRGEIQVASEQRGDAIIVSVRDTGAGMDQETLARLGEPFFTTKPIGTGSGLGLAVSFGIIERHRGTLRFESVPGAGTTAIVTLPIDPEE